MNAEHTPGPWTCRKVDNPQGVDAYRRAIQSAWYVCGPEHDSDFVADVFVKHDERAEANARLIAAAPDLLEALHLLVDNFSPCNCGRITYCGFCMASAAIAKATGGAA